MRLHNAPVALRVIVFVVFTSGPLFCNEFPSLTVHVSAQIKIRAWQLKVKLVRRDLFTAAGSITPSRSVPWPNFIQSRYNKTR